MAKQFNGIKLKDGTVIGADVLGCLVASYNDDGTFKNLQIVTPEGHKINFESGDNVAFKPMSKVQWDVAHRAETARDEFEMSVINDKKTKVEGLKMEVAGLKFFNNDADTSLGWNKNVFKIIFKKTKDLWTKLNLKAGSIDIRAHSTGDGNGGGIAIQIAGRDSSGKENKFKIETDRTTDVDVEDSAESHAGEGGKGIEIGTINAQMTSLFTKTYRFKGDAPIYAVTRGEVTETTSSDGETKHDYPTQADDSKDIIPDAQMSHPLTLNKLYQLVSWAEGIGFNPR